MTSYKIGPLQVNFKLFHKNQGGKDVYIFQTNVKDEPSLTDKKYYSLLPEDPDFVKDWFKEHVEFKYN